MFLKNMSCVAVRIKKTSLSVFFLFSFLNIFSAEQSGILKPSTNGLDIMLYNVDLILNTHDGNSITYSCETNGKTRISFTEHKKRFRVRSVYPSKGTVYINVPKSMVLESCRIHLSYASAAAENIRCAYFTSAVSEGGISVKDCIFKTAVFNSASGTLDIKAEIISAADVCTADSKASVVLPGSLNDYNFYYSQGAFSSFNVDGKPQTEPNAVLGNKKSKKRIRVIAGTSEVSLSFVKTREQTEKPQAQTENKNTDS